MKFKTMEWFRTRARSDKNYSINNNNNNQGRIRDEFRFVKRLGQGNMGTVFMAVHSRSQKIFAMKVINKETLRSRNAYKLAATEKEILSSLDHPFLPSLLTHFESENYTFLAMKYCPGGDINILRHKQPNKRFSEATIRFYAAEVVMALEYLHDHGIVYGDLKPENILVQDNGHIMLTDFDLSLRLASAPEERDLQGRGELRLLGGHGGVRSSGGPVGQTPRVRRGLVVVRGAALRNEPREDPLHRIKPEGNFLQYNVQGPDLGRGIYVLQL